METKYYVIAETVCDTCLGEGVLQHSEVTCPDCDGNGSEREEVELTMILRKLCAEGKVECQKLRGIERA